MSASLWNWTRTSNCGFPIPKSRKALDANRRFFCHTCCRDKIIPDKIIHKIMSEWMMISLEVKLDNKFRNRRNGFFDNFQILYCTVCIIGILSSIKIFFPQGMIWLFDWLIQTRESCHCPKAHTSQLIWRSTIKNTNHFHLAGGN